MWPDSQEIVQITLEGGGGDAAAQLVSCAVPLPQGMLRQEAQLSLRRDDGSSLPAGFEVTGRWHDGSVKWLHCEFFWTPCSGEKGIALCLDPGAGAGTGTGPSRLESGAGEISVSREGVRLVVSTKDALPFKSIDFKDAPLLRGSGLRLALVQGGEARLEVRKAQVRETAICTVMLLSGVALQRGDLLAEFEQEIRFYGSLLRVELTLRNPRNAKHPGGLWDLGDANSLYVAELAQELALAPPRRAGYSHGGAPLQHCDCFTIYQGGSGGTHPRHENHFDRHGEVPIDCSGYQVRTSSGIIEEGSRSGAEVVAEGGGYSVALLLEGFWQNFPKAVQLASDRIRLGLFPREHQAGYELQPGEQKSHRYFLQIAERGARLDWVHHPVQAQLPREWYCSSGTVPYLASAATPWHPALEQTIAALVDGDNTLWHRREAIDEYGWRNFGDIFADHEYYENANKPDLARFVSHYNNQYDVLYSLLFQYFKSNDRRWFALASELASHIVDIDIYHTDADRSWFNNGLLWHTDHFVTAHTATHRTFSVRTVKEQGLACYGGGPGYDHNYTRGLKFFYFLTGDRKVRQAVLKLADWTVRGIDGTMTLLEQLEGALRRRLRRNPGLRHYTFDGPGRSSGNALNACLDAFELSGDRFYLAKAEKLITMCVAPDDDIAARNLLEPNIRWTYTVFMMALENYLHLKREAGECDAMYGYTAACFRNYALWMSRHEGNLFERKSELDFPNFATRAAQDLRKAAIMLCARKYCEASEATRLQERALAIYRKSADFLAQNENRFLIRPTAVVMTVEGALKSGLSGSNLAGAPLPPPASPKRPGRLESLASSLRYTSPVREWRMAVMRIEELMHSRRR